MKAIMTDNCFRVCFSYFENNLINQINEPSKINWLERGNLDLLL